MKRFSHPGERLRLLRIERGLSQRALAKQAEISPNSISLIERNKISPNITTLQALATALDVHINYFFEENPTQKILHIKAKKHPAPDQHGISIESLKKRLYQQTLEPFIVHLAPRSSNGKEQVVHSGQEMVYCLQGKIEYHIGKKNYRLDTGDFLIFDANQPHLWHNPYNEPAKFILVTSGAQSQQISGQLLCYPFSEKTAA